MGDKVANFTGVKNYINHAWGNPRRLKITELGPNCFQFHFEDEVEKKKALTGGPWIMGNQVFVLREWEVGWERDSNFFRYVFLWVQLWNLPVHWLSRAVGFKLGQIFKSIREVIIPEVGGKVEGT